MKRKQKHQRQPPSTIKIKAPSSHVSPNSSTRPALAASASSPSLLLLVVATTSSPVIALRDRTDERTRARSSRFRPAHATPLLLRPHDSFRPPQNPQPRSGADGSLRRRRCRSIRRCLGLSATTNKCESSRLVGDPTLVPINFHSPPPPLILFCLPIFNFRLPEGCRDHMNATGSLPYL